MIRPFLLSLTVVLSACVGRPTAQTGQGTSPLDPTADAVVMLSRLADELGQVVADDPEAAVSYAEGGMIEVVVGQKRQYRRLAATLRNYPRVRVFTVGDPDMAAALRAGGLSESQLFVSEAPGGSAGGSRLFIGYVD